MVTRLWDDGKALGQALCVPLQLPMLTASFHPALNLRSRFFQVPSQSVPGHVALGSVSLRCAGGVTGTIGLFHGFSCSGWERAMLPRPCSLLLGLLLPPAPSRW